MNSPGSAEAGAAGGGWRGVAAGGGAAGGAGGRLLEHAVNSPVREPGRREAEAGVGRGAVVVRPGPGRGLRDGVLAEKAGELAGFLGRWGGGGGGAEEEGRRRGGLDRGGGGGERGGEAAAQGVPRRVEAGQGRGGGAARGRRGGLDGRRRWRSGRWWRGEAGGLAGVEEECKFSGLDLGRGGGGEWRRCRRRGGLTGEPPGPFIEGGEAIDDGGDGVGRLVRVLDFEQLAAGGGGTGVEQSAKLEQQGCLCAPGSGTPEMEEDLLAGRHLAGEEGFGFAVEDEFDQFVALIEAHV